MKPYVILGWAVVGVHFSQCAFGQSQGMIADYVVTEVKHMTDGNRIEQTLVGEYAQDHEGRTRLRFNDVTVIADPVDNVSWQVDIPNGIAFRESVNWNMADEVNRESDGLEEGAFDIPTNPLWPQAADFQDIEVTELGVRLINGVESTGRRWTHSIPAGAVGNVEPIEINTEVWTTDAFGYTLPMLSITEDALNGVTRSEMKNVRSVEFDLAYFGPDERYEIRDVDSNSPWLRSHRTRALTDGENGLSLRHSLLATHYEWPRGCSILR